MHIVSFVFNLHLVSHLKHHMPEKLLPTQRDMEVSRLDRCYRAEFVIIPITFAEYLTDNDLAIFKQTSFCSYGYYWQAFLGWSYERYEH